KEQAAPSLAKSRILGIELRRCSAKVETKTSTSHYRTTSASVKHSGNTASEQAAGNAGLVSQRSVLPYPNSVAKPRKHMRQVTRSAMTASRLTSCAGVNTNARLPACMVNLVTSRQQRIASLTRFGNQSGEQSRPSARRTLTLPVI